MPHFFIHAVNSEYESRDDGAEYATEELAMAAGVRSAIGLAADEVQNGRVTAAVQISVEREDGTTVRRSVLALSVSPLLISEG